MNPTTIHGIVYYLLSHQMRIKQELTDYTNQYDALKKDPNNSLFLDDINDQYNKMIKSHLFGIQNCSIALINLPKKKKISTKLYKISINYLT